jgi:hypothetical protein
MNVTRATGAIAAAAAIVLIPAMAYDWWLALSAVAFLAACMAAIATAPGRLGLLSWSAGIPAFYAAFFFVLPLLIRIALPADHEADRVLADAFWVATLGMLGFAAGTNLMRLVPRPAASYDLGGLLRLDVARNPSIFVVFAVIGVAALLWSYAFGYFGLIGTRGGEVGEVAGPVTALGFLLSIAHVMAWHRFFATRERRLLWFGVVSTVLMAGLGMLANSKGQIVMPFFLIGACLWGVSGRFPFKLVAVSLLLYVFVAFPFVTASRFAYSAAEFTGSRDLLAEVALDYLLSGEWLDDAAHFSVVQSLGRDLLPYFAVIVQQAGTTVDFMAGRTFSEALEILVPRFLNPDKPDMSIGNWTAHAFGMIEPDDGFTNLSPTYMGELYMNFGAAGVLFGMSIVGALAVLVDRYLVIDRRAWTMPIMLSFVGWQESFFGHTIIPFLKNAVLWAPILLLAVYLAGASRTRGRQYAGAPSGV